VPFPVQVLAESVVSDGLGHRHVTGYRYRDGWYAPDTREFRGFAQVVRTELGDASEATAVAVHGFDLGHAAECRKGSLLSLEARTETGALLVRDTYAYATRTALTGLDGRAVVWAERTKHEAEHWEGAAAPVATREEWTHDDYGNVLVHSEWGIVEGSNALAGHDERVTTTGYLNDADRWLLGRAFHTLVADVVGLRIGESYTYYDGEPFKGLGLGQLGAAGAPTRSASWVAGDHFADTERLQRDAYGLVTATSVRLGRGGRSTTTPRHTRSPWQSAPSTGTAASSPSAPTTTSRRGRSFATATRPGSRPPSSGTRPIASSAS
jgi:hypothetical protein